MTVIDQYAYTKSPGNGVSFGRSPDGTGGWTIFTNPNPGSLNSTGDPCLPPATPTPTSFPTSTPTPTPIPPTPTPQPSIPTPTIVPTKIPTVTISAASDNSTKSASPTAQMLGVESDSLKPTPQIAEKSWDLGKLLIPGLLIMAAGFAIMALATTLQRTLKKDATKN